MSQAHSTEQIPHELTHLHATTCLLMTRFINGHHCPKLAHLIVQKLEHLLSHPELEKVSTSRNMYQQLLEHWQNVTSLLQEKKAVHRQSAKYH
jgi:hypothetical protein